MSEYNIKNINEKFQEIFYEDQINYAIQKYNNEINNMQNEKESNSI